MEIPVDLPSSGETPRHGYRGQPGEDRPELPVGLTIAISREAGARGTTIAQRVGTKLGWQVYTQEMLEFMAQEGKFRASGLPPKHEAWVEERIETLLREQNLSRHPAVLDLARMVLTLASEGEAVLLGRGAGCLLPPHACLNVRLVAPLADRIAYMSQWMRLTQEEAAEQVHRRDERRAAFVSTHYHRQPSDLYQYDLVLNTSRLGEERSAELICQAARAKLS